MDQFCTKCGTRLVNGSCPNCSGAQAMTQAQQPQTQYQPQEFVDDVDEIDPNDERFKSFFMSPKEKFVCALGNWYLMNFLAGGFLGKGFAVISDKRVYFKGKSYEIGAKRLKTRTSASTVDLKDVTGTEVRTTKNLGLIIIGWVCVILGGILIGISSGVSNGGIEAMFVTFGSMVLFAGIAFIIAFFISRKTMITIMFGGGGIAFPLNWYPTQEGENFQKSLRIAKDNAVEEAENATANAVRAAMSNSAPQPQAVILSADELAKYAQLYKDGLITEQEFADIKARLLAKQ